jgi:Spy/CpxP family protein refolding chaperone
MYKLMMLPLLGVLATGTAMAQTTSASNSQTSDRQAMKQARLDKMAAKLGLNAQEKAAVQSTFEKYRSQMKPVFEDLKTTRQSLKTELSGSKDATRLTQLTQQLSSDRQKLASLQQAKQTELQGELTPQQFAQLVVSRHGRGGHHFRNRGDKPQE